MNNISFDVSNGDAALDLLCKWWSISTKVGWLVGFFIHNFVWLKYTWFSYMIDIWAYTSYDEFGIELISSLQITTSPSFCKTYWLVVLFKTRLMPCSIWLETGNTWCLVYATIGSNHDCYSSPSNKEYILLSDQIRFTVMRTTYYFIIFQSAFFIVRLEKGFKNELRSLN